MRSFIKFADQLSTSMGKAFSWCIVILMCGTCYEVVMAYAFNAPTLWNFDFSLQMYGAIFMMAGAYTLSTEAHVRGDVIYRLFKPRTQGWIDLILYFIFFFPGVLALAFYGYEYASMAWKISNEHIKIKVWERGAGLTKACGTAACATAVAANIDELENTVTEIEFKLGRLQIKIDQDKFIHMKGPVSEIQKITIKL